jgi:hypothetical protein
MAMDLLMEFNSFGEASGKLDYQNELTANKRSPIILNKEIHDLGAVD